MTSIERIRQYLKENNISQKKFTRLTGCSNSVIAKGKWYMCSTTLNKICKAFNAPVSTFCTISTADKLKLYRKNAKLSANDVAQLVNLDISTVYYHEQGKYVPTLKSLDLYAQLYGVPVEAFCAEYVSFKEYGIDDMKSNLNTKKSETTNKHQTFKISHHIACTKCSHRYDILDIAHTDSNKVYCMSCGTLLIDGRQEFISQFKNQLLEYANKL